eukprot:SAG31_NODE_32409_length_356_cov_0.805447_1_plen_32_part_10
MVEVCWTYQDVSYPRLSQVRDGKRVALSRTGH